jgi:peptidoglycan/xylan/chitin deacetylase (PgdA/CDA1 family)
LIEFLYDLFGRSGADQFVWRVDRRRLRILCYHGVCDDAVAGAAWVPSCFVSRSEFETHLQYLRNHTHVLPLVEAVRRLRDGALPQRAVAVTFDDGYANNMQIAYPLLRSYAISATIFLSTAYVESGEFFPFLVRKLIRLSRSGAVIPEYKTNPVDSVIGATRPVWPEIERRLEPKVRETLRPMRPGDLSTFDPKLITFGAHSHTHCIFKNESPERREQEIRVSVRRVADWTGGPTRTFAYPNGERGDFDNRDKSILRAAGIEAAVSGIAGANGSSADPLELRRYPMTLNHIGPRFSAEVSGFRNVVRAAVARMDA